MAFMQPWSISIGVAAVVIAVVVGLLIYGRAHTQHLRERFGSEYDRRVAAVGNRWRAESELAYREARVEEMKNHLLNESDRAKFMEARRLCQSRFVDDPAGAVEDADRLVTEIMRAHGDAVNHNYDRITDVCAAYPERAADYRAANDILTEHRRGQASTEDLRKAFVHFRALFDDMLRGQDEDLQRAA
jgi:hypothetical protein